MYEAPPFVSPSVVGSVIGPAPNVSVSTAANRMIHIEGHLETGSGKKSTNVWHQRLRVMFYLIIQILALRCDAHTVHKFGGLYNDRFQCQQTGADGRSSLWACS
jgi:hypothetical protein